MKRGRRNTIVDAPGGLGRLECGRRGFTLIELLIVVGILPIATFGAFGLAAAMESRAQGLRDRSQQGALIGQTLETWRREVEIASEVATEGDGTIRIVLDGPGGAKRVVRYALKGQRLEREEEGKPTTVAAESVAAAGITSEAGAWHLKITTANGEGPARIERTYEAWASPITARGGEAGR